MTGMARAEEHRQEMQGSGPVRKHTGRGHWATESAFSPPLQANCAALVVRSLRRKRPVSQQQSKVLPYID
jgi:hypothetical protein